MASFVAMIPPEADARSEARGEERAVFVRDGFAWLGFIFPLFWLLWHRLWIEAAVVLALMLSFGALGDAFQTPSAAVLVSFLVQLGVGLEGQNWRLAKLRRGGWREAGAIEAHDLDEAEMRFFAGRAEAEPAPALVAAALPPARPFGRPTPGAAPAPLGLIGYKG
ncbi:MAG TPA: DUF2628 domain-containing protein [Mesorhizobium sp.]|jgi:hypothetical protein|nr:DUF2628 domain-containing protein [Mesorhizobium sp.]